MTLGCQIALAVPNGERCGQPAVAYLRMGCEHEHIEVSRVCQECLTDAYDHDIVCDSGCEADHLDCVMRVLEEVPLLALAHQMSLVTGSSH